MRQILLFAFVMLLHSIPMAAPEFKQEPVPAQLISQSTRCPVKTQRLRLLTLSYYDFEMHQHHDGQMIVLDAVADDVLKIFRKLYAKKFPIAKIKLMTHYQNDDAAALKDNNTSSFNCREITGGSKVSLHSYGVAIDINPVQNPYLSTHDKPQGKIDILPVEGEYFINRSRLRPGMVEPIVKIMSQHGFNVWGGHWRFPIDYQHFQPSRFVTEMMAGLSPADAKQWFNLNKKYPQAMLKFSTQESEALLQLYQQSPKRFFQVVKFKIKRLNKLTTTDFINQLRHEL